MDGYSLYFVNGGRSEKFVVEDDPEPAKYELIKLLNRCSSGTSLFYYSNLNQTWVKVDLVNYPDYWANWSWSATGSADPVDPKILEHISCTVTEDEMLEIILSV